MISTLGERITVMLWANFILGLVMFVATVVFLVTTFAGRPRDWQVREPLKVLSMATTIATCAASVVVDIQVGIYLATPFKIATVLFGILVLTTQAVSFCKKLSSFYGDEDPWSEGDATLKVQTDNE